jgi:CDP-paratose 2-epimerase
MPQERAAGTGIALITGSAGLVGSESVRFFHARGFKVAGVDNDMRRYFFGDEAATAWNLAALKQECGQGFINHDLDIRDMPSVERLFGEYSSAITVIIHNAAQPSHDWAAREPLTDFGVNAVGTLNLLEAARKHCPNAVFIFMSTNKVYGDHCNHLPLVERDTRWELDPSHRFAARGIDESMPVDQCKHSLFGASKLAADIMVQEYGRYFGMKTGIFRGGCLSGPRHSGVEQHGYLAYLMKCAVIGREYKIYGHKGKQVRDNIHSHDLVNAFYHFYQDPGYGEVYNIGGGRFSHVSMREAIALCERITGKNMAVTYEEDPRFGDHRWWVSDVSKFMARYPGWSLTHHCEDILQEIYSHNRARWTAGQG